MRTKEKAYGNSRMIDAWLALDDLQRNCVEGNFELRRRIFLKALDLLL